jgi:hypothetical protein
MSLYARNVRAVFLNVVAWFILYSLQISLLLSLPCSSLVPELINQFPLIYWQHFTHCESMVFIHVFSLASALFYLLHKLKLHQSFNIYVYDHIGIECMYIAVCLIQRVRQENLTVIQTTANLKISRFLVGPSISTSHFNICALYLIIIIIIIIIVVVVVVVVVIIWCQFTSYSEKESVTYPKPYHILLLSWNAQLQTPIYRMFQKELYNFESLYKFIQSTCTVFWTVIK